MAPSQLLKQKGRLVNYALVISNSSKLAAEFFWIFQYQMVMYPALRQSEYVVIAFPTTPTTPSASPSFSFLFFRLMARSLPDLKVDINWIPYFYRNGTIRSTLFWMYIAFSLTLPVIPLVLADYYNANPDTRAYSEMLFSLGLYFEAAICLVYFVILVFIHEVFRRAVWMKGLVEANAKLNESNPITELLILTLTKVWMSMESVCGGKTDCCFAGCS